MPTATKTSAASGKARTKAARKPAGAKASRSTAQTRAVHAKGARTSAVHKTESAVRQTQTATIETVGVVGDYAERAILIPVGAALTARDRVVSGVSDTVSTYSSPTRAQAQLRRFERRGATARNRLEREVRKARVRLERQLRQRRRELEKRVKVLDDRREEVAKNGSDLANRVQERLLNLV